MGAGGDVRGWRVARIWIVGVVVTVDEEDGAYWGDDAGAWGGTRGERSWGVVNLVVERWRCEGGVPMSRRWPAKGTPRVRRASET